MGLNQRRGRNRNDLTHDGAAAAHAVVILLDVYRWTKLNPKAESEAGINFQSTVEQHANARSGREQGAFRLTVLWRPGKVGGSI